VVEIRFADQLVRAGDFREENVGMEPLRRRGAGLRASAALAVILCCLIAASAASAKTIQAPKGILYAKVSRACAAPKPGDAACYALVREPVPSAAAAESGVRPYKANDGALESGPAGGLTPAELASAYGYDPTAGGSGQTIAIVDAYDDPSIEGDLETFDTEYGIAQCTKKNGCLTKVSQTGSTTLPEADTTGWSVEISLDVEIAHSACPECKILLVEAKNASFQNLATAVKEAVALGATEVSNSYGGPEGELGTTETAAYNQPGVVITAATGDYGYDDWTELNEGFEPPGRPNMPASLPSVVAVGGTTLELNETGKRKSETVWNGNGPLDESEFAEGATGGGCSTLFIAELWQREAPGFGATDCGSKRLTADVSAVADPYTGFDIYDSYNCGEACENFKRGHDWLTIGGTSLSSPLISALYALAGGSNGVSYPSLTLYGHLGESSSLYDVTEGGNGICDDDGLACGANEVFGVNVDCEGTTACNAAPGFDGPSGVGTPNGLSLFEPLLPTAAIAPPTSLKAGVGASFSAAGSRDPYPGATLSYSWNWGDTSTGTGAAPSHTYAAPGEYTVTLTVSDSYGFKSTPATTSVQVTARTAKELKEEQEAKEAKEREAREAKEAKEREEAKAKEVKEQEATKAQEAKELREAKEAKQNEEAALKKKLEEEAAAKSSVNAGSQGVNGFQVHLAPPIPDAQLASTSLQVSRAGTVTLKISCPAGETSCSGTITLRTLTAVIAGDGHAARQKPSVLTLAGGSFTVAGGKVQTLTLHLSVKARALLARTHTLRARATLLAHDLQGATHTTLTIVTLRAPKAAHHNG
jgi:PKD repeat protein